MLSPEIVTGHLELFSAWISAFVAFVGVAVMAVGAFRGILLFVRCACKKEHQLPRIRIELGKHLSLGLEFLVGADIIRTIADPTWDQLGKLGAIVALRTVVTFLLSWELKEVKEELQESIKKMMEHS